MVDLLKVWLTCPILHMVDVLDATVDVQETMVGVLDTMADAFNTMDG